ncbi:Nucleosome assembly protein (NAP), partial [Cynara cardunculus var. scolymus]
RYTIGLEVERTNSHSPHCRALVTRLEEIDVELKKVNEEASDKVLEIEQHYNGKRRPVYFMTHPALGDFLTDEDEKEFKPNPYFEDTKLVKTIAFCDEGTMKITGTNIKWKEGMSVDAGFSADIVTERV